MKKLLSFLLVLAMTVSVSRSQGYLYTFNMTAFQQFAGQTWFAHIYTQPSDPDENGASSYQLSLSGYSVGIYWTLYGADGAGDFIPLPGVTTGLSSYDNLTVNLPESPSGGNQFFQIQWGDDPGDYGGNIFLPAGQNSYSFSSDAGGQITVQSVPEPPTNVFFCLSVLICFIVRFLFMRSRLHQSPLASSLLHTPSDTSARLSISDKNQNSQAFLTAATSKMGDQPI